jgi:hypothetical protein
MGHRCPLPVRPRAFIAAVVPEQPVLFLRLRPRTWPEEIKPPSPMLSVNLSAIDTALLPRTSTIWVRRSNASV